MILDWRGRLGFLFLFVCINVLFHVPWLLGWRPFVGWTCGIALCYHFVLQPFLVFLLYSFGYQVDLPQFDMTTLTTILMGMLGLGGLRSYEKVKKSA